MPCTQDPISGQCFPFTVSKVEGMGRLVAFTFRLFLLSLSLPLFRVLIAATDFEPGDFVFREKELVVGDISTKYSFLLQISSSIR